MKRTVVLILIIGVALRAAVFLASPPSNSYDDHLEAVAFHVVALRDFQRVDPWQCWQCYQPPLYYWVSAYVVTTAFKFVDLHGAWKSVQFLSFLASTATLLLTAAALLLVLKKPRSERLALYFSLAVIAVLPRSLFSSAMATNDALLEAGVALCLVGYLLIIKRENRNGLGLLLVSVGTLMSCWTKQSGLIFLGPLAVLILIIVSDLWHPHQRVSTRFVVLSLVAVFFFSGLDEVWRSARTGIFLVSNQDFFPYAASQLPGSIDKVSFFDFRGINLFNHVFMESETLSSFWTELFARLWFDYERRFFPIDAQSLLAGRIAYTFGGIVSLFAVFFASSELIRKPLDAEKLLLIFIVLAFLAVPVLQTFRMPYFSSMKATFLLPGAPAFLCLVSLGASRWLHLGVIRILIGASIGGALAFGVFLTFMFFRLSSEAWLGLSGPLWPLPQL